MASPFAAASRGDRRPSLLGSWDGFAALHSGTFQLREEGNGDRWYAVVSNADVSHADESAEEEAEQEAQREQIQRSSKVASKSSPIDSANERHWVGARKTWRKVDRVVVDGGEHELAKVLRPCPL